MYKETLRFKEIDNKCASFIQFTFHPLLSYGEIVLPL